MRSVVFTALAPVVLLGLGCAHHERRLLPEGSEDLAPGLRDAVTQDLGGVQLTVQSDAWPSDVTSLERDVTPVLVSIDNKTSGPVLVRHKDFVLRGESGAQYVTIPPRDVRIPNPNDPTLITQPVFGPGGTASNDKNLRPWRPGPMPVPATSQWESSFPYDRFYFRGVTVTPEARRAQPQARALPEGMLPRGARAVGFVYFTNAVYAEERLVFQATLMRGSTDPGAAASYARAAIPMRVQ